MSGNFKKPLLTAGFVGVLALTLLAGRAQAQDSDDFDVSVSTNAAVAIACGQDLSFGSVYVAATNLQATVTLSTLSALSSNQATVVASGGAVGQCTISGLQGADTATVTLSGGGGTPAAGGLTGVSLSDGAAHTLTAAIQVGGGSNTTGGKTGLANGVIPFFGTVVIPASHLDFGTYDATLTATVALD